MDANTVSIVGQVIASTGAVAAAFVAQRASRNASDASTHARRAVENTRPMSNGFASDVLSRLGRIERLITNHLEDHASSDVKRRKP